MRKWIIGATAVLAIASVVACGGSGDTKGPGAQNGQSKAGGHAVTLEVTGSGTADITFGLGTDQSQENGSALPWKKDLNSTDALLIASVVAQSKSGAAGAINCKITVDGKVVKENASSGQYAVVTCNNT